MFEGSHVALVTPFKGGVVDLKKVAELTERQRAEGTRGIMPVGTTGEGPTVEAAERIEIIRAVKKAAGKMKVVPGAGTNSTKTTIEAVKLAADAGADGVLLVGPYYNKPTQEGFYRHFEAVAHSTKLPIMLYNIPSRTASNIAAETVARLSKFGNIVALKESSGSIEQVAAIRAACGIEILSGDDATIVPVIEMGGVGVVSVAANIVPRRIADLVALAHSGKREKARALQKDLMSLIKTLFIETNPGPVKCAMRMMGLIEGEMRLPLVPPSAAAESAIAAMLNSYKLLPGEKPSRRPALSKR